MVQVFQTAVRNSNGSQSALAKQMYYARKRRRARAQVTSGVHGGMRLPAVTFGLKMKVQLTLQ